MNTTLLGMAALLLSGSAPQISTVAAARQRLGNAANVLTYDTTGAMRAELQADLHLTESPALSGRDAAFQFSSQVADPHQFIVLHRRREGDTAPSSCDRNPPLSISACVKMYVCVEGWFRLYCTHTQPEFSLCAGLEQI